MISFFVNYLSAYLQIHSLQIFSEHLVNVKHYVKHWGQGSEKKRKKKKATQRKKQEKTVIFGFMQLTF